MKNSDWKYEDIPLSDWEVKTTADPVTGEIEQITRIMQRIEKQIIQTKSDHIRNRLMDLGWTPPKEG